MSVIELAPVIPARLRARIIRHGIAVNVINRYPMMLAIQGAPGDGKSFQTRAVLEQAGFRTLGLSGALLSGSFEGEAITRLKQLYRTATAIGGDRQPAAILLEDFDLSPVSEKAETGYTANSQLLAGFLMNLADDPGMCDVGTTKRIPIFLTANDLVDVHGPLMRPGRMDFFAWEPTDYERAEMFQSVLGPVVDGVDIDVCSDLVRRYPKVTVATMATAVHWCQAQRIEQMSLSSRSLSFALIRDDLAHQPRMAVQDIVNALELVLDSHGPRRYMSRRRGADGR